MMTTHFSSRLSLALLLALFGVLAFPSCSCDGANEPTPPEPSSETRSLIATMKVTKASKIEGNSTFLISYDYDGQGRATLLRYSEGSSVESTAFTYGDETISIQSADESTPHVLRADKGGRLLGGSIGDGSELRFTYDSEGRLSTIVMDQLSVTNKWGSDRLLERHATLVGAEEGSSNYSYRYTDLKDPVGLTFLVLPELMMLPPGWFGEASAYLPAKYEQRSNTFVGGLPVLNTLTYSYTLDAKSRPTKIEMVEDFRSLSDKFIPDNEGQIATITIDLTYVEKQVTR